jgi:sugar phosphate isomerase/epimerase
MIPTWLTDTVTSDLQRALHYTKLWGLQGVELRTVGEANDRVPDVNEKQIRRHLDTSETLIASCVPSVFEGPVSDRASWMNDLVQFEDTLQFCGRVGCPRVVLSPFAAEPNPPFDAMADAIRRAGEKAAAYDTVLAVLHGPETACPTGRALAELLALVDHPNVQAAWDPAGAMRAGEDPAEGLGALVDRVSLVRCSDGRVRDGYWEDLPLGEGVVDWGEQLRRLAAHDFLGPISLEVYVEPRPEAGLRAATTLIHMLRDVRAGKDGPEEPADPRSEPPSPPQ